MRRAKRFVQDSLFDEGKIDRRSGPERRDAAIAATIRKVGLSKEETFLAATSREKLVARAKIFDGKFSADDVAIVLDLAGIPREMILRRRLSSAILNGGRGKLWRITPFFIQSQDPIRNARRLPVWELLTEGVESCASSK